MKITKDMVGKKVRRSRWSETKMILITSVGRDNILAVDPDDDIEERYVNHDFWELVEEPELPKLPSEILGLDQHLLVLGPESVTEKLKEIAKFLDDQAKKGVFK